jgi:hypothetical protein
MNTTVAHSKSSLWICLALISISVLLVLTDGKRIPGGPFVSFHAEVLPVVGCLAVLFFVARDFRAVTIARRAALSVFAFISVGVIALVIQFILSFWHEPSSRGVLFGW